MPGMLARLGTTLLVCLALSAAPALAQGQDKGATASDLFQRGLDDMLAGQFDTGCPRLAESYRLDPRLGTLFTLAECENKAGRIGSATRHYRQYLQLFAGLTPDLQEQQKGREKISAEALGVIEPRAPKLTVIVPAEAPAGTVVRLDGQVLEASALGQPVPLDPGEHLVTTQVPEQPVKEVRLTLALGESRELVVEVPPPPPPPPPIVQPAPEEPSDGSTLRTTGLIVGGVGLVAVVAGAVTGGLAMSENSTAKDNCDGTVCNQDGLDAIDSVRPLGNASTALFVVGGVGVAAGVLMFILAPSGGGESDDDAGDATAKRGLVLRPWVGGTADLGAVTGIRGAW